MVKSFRYTKTWTLFLALTLAHIALPVLAAPANTPPPESTSKLKKVLLYNNVGGWYARDGVASVKQYMSVLAKSKGFELDSLSDATRITLEFLKQYQVIVWNNNSNAAISVPISSARKAIVEYVNQGGGWFLIGLAGDHANSWPAFTDMLGATFRIWSGGVAKMLVDSSALHHPELRFVVQDLPPEIRLNETWMSFDRTVRPLANVTVLYTARNISGSVVVPLADGSGDHPYVWARTIQSGKMLYCSSGWSSAQPSPLAQADSAVAKIYWNSMRWLAGDFQNGCTDPRSAHFNPEARMDDGTCYSGKVRIVEGHGKRSHIRQPMQTRLRSTSLQSLDKPINHDVRGRTLIPLHFP